jgi:hypothetical protein
MAARNAIGKQAGRWVVLALAAGAIAGCGGLTGTAATTAAPTATAVGSAATAVTTASPSAVTARPTPSIVHAAGAADLVLRMAAGGGLLPTELRLGEMPDVSVYGDGTVLFATTAGLQPNDPLLPVVTMARLTPAGFERLLGAAAVAGIVGANHRYGLEGVYDLWTVTFTVDANGMSGTTSAYALGFSDEERLAPPADLPARRALRDLAGRLRDLPTWLGSDLGVARPYEPAAYAVSFAPLVDWSGATGGSPVPVTARPGQAVRAWPVGAPDQFGTVAQSAGGSWRCAVLSRAAATSWDFASATADTRWTAGGMLYRVVVRPLLPEQSDCAR